MKYLIKIILSLLVTFILLNTESSAQDKKSEQKIKIVVADGSGSKVVIDTLIKDGSTVDSVRLKDGKVIFFHNSGNEANIKHVGGSGDVFVTMSDDGKKIKKEVRTITIVSSDSADLKESFKGDNVFVYNSSGKAGANYHYKVIRGDSLGEGKNSKEIIYINKSKVPKKGMGKNIDVTVTSDDKAAFGEKTTYVIAKDGMVVTVEGNDNAKTKELVKEIKKEMKVKAKGSDKKETINVETKKSVKK
jgi:hypothetical protein